MNPDEIVLTENEETVTDDTVVDETAEAPEETEAETECVENIEEAEAEKTARIAEAEGQAERFEKMYEEYSKFPLITKKRMFYEAMEDTLPDLKVIISDGSTQTLLPLETFGN